MRIFKLFLFAAIVASALGAHYSAQAGVGGGGTTIECDDSDMVCARVGNVEVYGKAKIIVKE